MKRALLAVGILIVLIILGAATLAAQDDGSSLVIRPFAMKDGETKTLIDDGRRITVRRNGDAVNIEIEGAEETRKLTILRSGEGDIVIDRENIDRDNSRKRVQVLAPGTRITVDGVPGMSEKKSGSSESWFVCPEDHSMLRVPEGKEGATYKCPVDGTVMEKKKGRGFTIWMGEGTLEATRL